MHRPGVRPRLKTHVHGALHVGLRPRDLREEVLHLVLCPGFPTVFAGFTVAHDAIAAREFRSP